jgi:diguanylate cyclase (GGDEF)-like protein
MSHLTTDLLSSNAVLNEFAGLSPDVSLIVMSQEQARRSPRWSDPTETEGFDPSPPVALDTVAPVAPLVRTAAPLLPTSTHRFADPQRPDVQRDTITSETTSTLDATPSFLANLVAPPGVLGAAGLSEAQREPAYHDELLTLYRHRLRLLAMIAMATLPACIGIYAWLLPGVLRQVVPVYSILFAYAFLMRAAVGKTRTLTVLRLTTLTTYVVFSMGAAVVIALIGDHNALLYSSHNHIILSALLLPFTVWECGVISAIVIGSLAWAGWWSLPQEQTAVYASYLYLLCTTSLFVLCVTHFQCVLRRRAFDAAFDLVRSKDKLQTLSFMDTLTGGYNRRYLEQTLTVEIARAVRFNRPLSVMMFDLDNFKAVNDTRGHAAGDEVLREVWQAALGTLREVDAAARYGGDEFSVILPETDETAAYGVAERLQSAVRYRLHARFGEASPEGRVTVSVGIVTVRPGETGAPSTDYLMDAADERLYEAKRRGKNLITA